MKPQIVIALVATLATGCKNKPTAAEGAAPGGSGTTEAASTETEALAAKQDAYVHCLNTFSNDVFHGRHTWLDEFDAKKGPQAKQASDTLYGPLELDDPKECREGVAAAKMKGPKLPALEAAGDAYVAAIAELQPLTVKLRDYFEQKNYKDDKLALAIESHPKLMAAWDRFAAANDALGKEVDKIEDQLNAAQLAELEKTEGKQLHWHHKRMLIEAKKVVGIAAAAASPFDVKNPAELQAAVAALDKASTELLDYYDKHKAEIEKASISYSIDSELKRFVTDAKELMRRNRDKTAFSDGEKMTIRANNAESVEGHPARVIAAYNALIQSSNRLRF
ncbi:MAG TPA: YiiG family protein [Kofleriaceae bacterium]|nr:YiiG family protein [Kofleriaceae bacterium]